MKTLLLDIETAPHKVFVWGLYNQNISIDKIDEPGYTLCWAAKWHGEEEKMFSSIYHDDPFVMLWDIYALIDEADAVVHYNGTKFDMPKLYQEFLEAGWKPPSPVHEIDLYKTVKKRFSFPSNKLTYICEQLSLGTKVKHKGMELWRECMDMDPQAWSTMKEYNLGDLDLLEALYNNLLPWIPGHANRGLYSDISAHICPNCGSTNLEKRGLYHAKTQSYQRFHCNDCGKWSRGKVTVLPKEKRSAILVGVE